MTLDIEKLENRLKADLKSVISSFTQAVESAATVQSDQSSVGRASRMDAIQQPAWPSDFRIAFSSIGENLRPRWLGLLRKASVCAVSARKNWNQIGLMPILQQSFSLSAVSPK